MKNLLLLFLLAGLVFGLSQFLMEKNQKDLQEKTITHLTLWDLPPKSLPLERQLWEETVQSFEKANPDIQVEGVERQYQPEEFVAVMAGGKGPDVVKVWTGAIQTLANLGFLEPVDSYLKGWSQADFIKQVLMDSTKVGDFHYGVPADSYFLFLLYRKDLFTKAGLNPDNPPAKWDDLVADARALTHRDEGQCGLGLVPKTWYFQDFVWQAGGEMTKTGPAGQTEAAFDEPKAVTALDFWKSLRWKYNVLEPDVLMPETELLHLFALGKVAMILGTEKDLPALVSRYKIDPQTIGIAPLPAGPAGPAAHLSGDIYIINANTTPEKKAAAWKWIAFELDPQTQVWKWGRMHDLNMPIYPGAFSSAVTLTNIPGYQRVQDAIATARVEPHVNGWPQVRDLLDEDPLEEVLLDPDSDPQRLLLANAKEADMDIFSKK